jgi:hypothetical protein
MEVNKNNPMEFFTDRREQSVLRSDKEKKVAVMVS